MSFLTLNGVALSVAVGSYSETPREIGSTSQAFDGTLVRSRLARKHDCEFSTTWLASATALAWESLIAGLGHVLSVDSDLYTSKGLGPDAGATATQATAGSSKFGAGYLSFSGAQTITYSASLGSSWTVALWRSTDGGSTYTHYLVNSSAQKWVDGSRNDAASTGFISVSSGALTMADTDSRIDDVVMLPFLAPTDWPPVWGVAASAFPSLPNLTLAGNCVHEASSRTVIGTVGSTALEQGYSGGAWAGNLRKLAVRLDEV